MKVGDLRVRGIKIGMGPEDFRVVSVTWAFDGEDYLRDDEQSDSSE
jgi:hypothetical protein